MAGHADKQHALMAQQTSKNIRAIPTQIFFDSSGKEAWRHAGFLEKKVISQKLDELLH